MGRRPLLLKLQSGAVLKAPLAFLNAKNGAIPHLTRETLDILEQSLIMQTKTSLDGYIIPLNWLNNRADVIKEYKLGLQRFMGLPERSPSIVCPQDPCEALKSGYHQNKSISVWENKNRSSVTPEGYMNAISAVKPDIFIALCDGDTPKDATSKRIKKAVSKTLDFLDVCVRKKEEDKGLGNSLLFGAVEGGLDRKARLLSAQQTASRPVDGFLLDGFHLNGCIPFELTPESENVIQETLAELPEDKPKMFLGSCGPKTVLQLVSLGVDLFDVSYAIQATEKGEALTFPSRLKTTEAVVNESLRYEVDYANGKEDDVMALKLSENRFKDDFRPISETCACYTCRKHTRAYINHLLTVNELLGPVLLMLHNIHHYLTFFKSIRDVVDDDIAFQSLQNLFLKNS